MCGRYTLTVPARLEAAFPQFRFPKLTPRYNIAPSTPILGLRNTGENEAEYLEWGLIPYWAGDERGAAMHINARAETVATKPAFREPLRLRRAIVFADGYYEWAKGAGTAKQPYFITRPGREPFTFAALWDIWHDPRGVERLTCALVTTNANSDVAWIHDRMPVVIDDDARKRWLTRESLDASEAAALLHPKAEPHVVAVPVSTAVNRTWRDDDPSLIELVQPPEQEKLF